MRRGLRRSIGTAPRRQVRPLGTDDIRRIVEHIDRGTAPGRREAALILLGFASAMRRSELAALTLADVAFQPGEVLVVRVGGQHEFIHALYGATTLAGTVASRPVADRSGEPEPGHAGAGDSPVAPAVLSAKGGS